MGIWNRWKQGGPLSSSDWDEIYQEAQEDLEEDGIRPTDCLVRSRAQEMLRENRRRLWRERELNKKLTGED